MKVLAIDIGYGHIKFVFVDYKNKVQIMKFPTAIAFYEGGFGGYADDEFFEFEDENYVVGEEAMTDTIDSRDPEFLVKYAPVFVAYAIKLSGMKPSDFGVISTGMSIFNWHKQVQFKESLSSFTVNKMRYKFKKVIVSKQGEGILYNESLAKHSKVLIIDGGYQTLDAIPFANGKLISKGAFANEFGVSKIVKNVQKEVFEITKENYSMSEINEFVKVGFLIHAMKKIKLDEIIRRAVSKYVVKFKATMKAELGEYLSRAEIIVIAGGLSYLLKDSDMPSGIIYSKRAEFANVMGYLKIAGES